MKKRNIENKELLDVLNRLRKNKKPVWKKTRELLLLPNRKRIAVNVSKLSKLSKASKDGEVTFVVPGKVLGGGIIKNKFRVIGFEYTTSALKKLKDAQCEYYRFKEIFNDKGETKTKGPFIIIK